MRLLKCDRCKRAQDFPAMDHWKLLEEKPHMKIHGRPEPYSAFDLCPDCAKKFRLWLDDLSREVAG